MTEPATVEKETQLLTSVDFTTTTSKDELQEKQEESSERLNKQMEGKKGNRYKQQPSTRTKGISQNNAFSGGRHDHNTK